MIFEVDKLFECGIEISKDNIHDTLMKNCTAYESGGISFVNFIEKIQESYTEYKNEMRSIMTEQEYSSYVLNEASFSSMASSIGTFIRRAVDVIMTAAQSFWRSVSSFFRGLIAKDHAEQQRSTFNMNFDNDPFSNINEMVFDYRTIDTVIRDKMPFLNPMDVYGTTVGTDAVAQHIDSITNGNSALYTRNNNAAYQEFLFGKVRLDLNYVSRNAITTFFATIQRASDYSLRNATALKQLCINYINKFNDAIAKETDADLLKYFNDVKNEIAAVMDFNIDLHQKQMAFIKNAMDQSQRIQEIYLRGNGARPA